MKLEFRTVKKSFKQKSVLTDISFSAESGKAFGLLGRNGAGKTTSIRILMDVFSADSGEILVGGEPVDYQKIRFGYLPEERGLYPKKEVFEQLRYFAELNGLSRSEAEAAVDRWLDRLGMSEYRNKRLDTLSKGNQQKIQLITALAHDPDIVILDEPFSGLDPVNSLLLKEVVKETISRNKIVLFSSHQMNYIEEFCDSIAIISNGQVVLTGDYREIKRSYPRNSLLVSSLQAKEIAAEFAEKCTVREDGLLKITFDDPSETGKMMMYLVENFAIDEIKIFEPSLNDIFIEYTKERI